MINIFLLSYMFYNLRNPQYFNHGYVVIELQARKQIYAIPGFYVVGYFGCIELNIRLSLIAVKKGLFECWIKIIYSNHLNIFGLSVVV